MLSTVLPPSCTLHMRGYHSWDNNPLFFQSFHLLSLLPLVPHLGPLAPHSRTWQEKHDACALTGHQSSSTCRSSPCHHTYTAWSSAQESHHYPGGNSNGTAGGSQGRQEQWHCLCPHTGDQVPFQLHNSNNLSSLVWRSEVQAKGGPSHRGK